MQPRSVDPITLRKWNALTWHDPRAVLVGLGIEQAKWQQQGVTVTLDDLRDDRALKRFSEPRQAALFAYLISEAVEKVPIQYAMIEMRTMTAFSAGWPQSYASGPANGHCREALCFS